MAPVQPTRSNSKTKRSKDPGLSLLWTSNLKTEEAKRSFQELLAVSNSAVWKRLLEIVREEKDKTYRSALKSSQYDSPSWAYQQADNVGYVRALDLVEQLIKGIVK